MSGLRVLMVGPYPLRRDKVVGGVEAVVSVLAPALATHDDIEQVQVLSCRRGVTSAVRVELAPRLIVWQLPEQERLALPTRSWLDVRRARRIAAGFRPHVVHGQGISSQGHIAAALSARPVVTAHGMVHVECRLASRGTLSDRARVWLTDRLVKEVLSRARVVISISAYDAEALKGLARGRRVSIANPVASDFFQVPDVETPQVRILFAGLLVRRKNVEGLLRALRHVRLAVPEAHLVIVGPSPEPAYLSELQALVASLQLTEAVTFKGHVENAELIDEVRQCRVVALFSHEETSPTILAQAMAAGKPVVASAVGGVPELISDGQNGYMVPATDETLLADRLVALLESPTLAQKMGACGREMAHMRCEPQAVARQTVQAYHLALEGRR